MIDQLETLTIKAIALKDSEYFYRKVCRYYSEKFHTPLLQVYDLPWVFVLNNYLEHVIETNNNKEDIYNLAIEICYPEKKVEEEQELEDWIKKVEKEEQEKLKAKQSPHMEEEPQEISIDSTSFSHLDEEMEQED